MSKIPFFAYTVLSQYGWGPLNYSLCSLKLATIFVRPGSNFHAIHVDYVDFLPELGW